MESDGVWTPQTAIADVGDVPSSCVGIGLPESD